MHIHWRPSLRSMPRQAEAVSPPSQSLASTATAKRFRTPAKSAARSTDIPVGIWQRAHRADRNIGPPTVLSGGGRVWLWLALAGRLMLEVGSRMLDGRCSP